MNKTLAENLKLLREEKGLKPEEVAVYSKVGITYYRNIESGRQTNPSLKILAKLSDFFGVSLDDLVGRKPPKKGKDIIMLPLDRVGKKAEHYR